MAMVLGQYVKRWQRWYSGVGLLWLTSEQGAIPSPYTPSKGPKRPNDQSINVDADDAPSPASPLNLSPSMQWIPAGTPEYQ